MTLELPSGGPQARGREREDNTLRPASGTRDTAAASSKFQHVERGAFRAICAGDGFHVRAEGIACLKTETHKSGMKVLRLAFLSRSAAHPPCRGGAASLPPLRAGVAGGLLPFWRGSRLFSSETVGAVLRLLRSLIGNARVKFLQEPPRRFANPFHVSTLSAGSSGLAGSLYGQQQTRRKLKCPTKALKGETR